MMGLLGNGAEARSLFDENKVPTFYSLPPIFLRFGLGKIQSLIHIALILLSLIPTLMYFKILS
jgi:hypothetical protein